MRLFGATLTALALVSGQAYAQSSEIGVLAAANRDVEGARPSENLRPIFVTDRLVQDELVRSSDVGGGQILFLDQTSLTIAPSSEFVLDRYVYDPDSRTGEIGISLVKGALRLVGGRITKQTPALINTPSGTIGIRGGIGHATVGADNRVNYVHIAGEASEINAGGQTLTISREGGAAQFDAAGIDYLGVVTAAAMDQVYSSRSAGAGAGGSTETVTPEAIDDSIDMVEDFVSGFEGADALDPISTVGLDNDFEDDEFSEEFDDFDDEALDDFDFAEDLADDLFQDFDSAIYTGTWDATTIAATEVINDPNAFIQINYDFIVGTGDIIFEVPAPTGFGSELFDQILDIGGGQTQLPIFDQSSDLDTGLIDPTDLTDGLGGQVSNSFIFLDTDITATGQINVDYVDSDLSGIVDSVSGTFVDVPGVTFTGPLQ